MTATHHVSLTLCVFAFWREIKSSHAKTPGRKATRKAVFVETRHESDSSSVPLRLRLKSGESRWRFPAGL